MVMVMTMMMTSSPPWHI